VCISSHRYPALYGHTPFCHNWPALLYKIFRYYLIKSMIFGGGGGSYLTQNLFRFSPHLLSGTFFILRRSQRVMVKNVNWSSLQITRYSCQILIKFEFFRHIFEKNTQISNLMKIRPMGAELFQAFRRTDRHNEAKSRFSQFYESA
jgi:hypothetical protein